MPNSNYVLMLRKVATNAMKSLLVRWLVPMLRSTGRSTAALVRRLKPPHKLGRIKPEPSGELDEVVQVEVALTTLKLSQERPMHPDLRGHRLLAKAQLGPALADALPENAGSL